MTNVKQIETFGKDGKRRIQPIMMAKIIDEELYIYKLVKLKKQKNKI